MIPAKPLRPYVALALVVAVTGTLILLLQWTPRRQSRAADWFGAGTGAGVHLDQPVR